MRDFVNNLLPFKANIMMYIMVFVSWYTGMSFIPPDAQWVGANESILYESGVLISNTLWGSLLAPTAAVLIWGLATRRAGVVRVFSFAAFVLWLFAAISLAANGHWFLFVVMAMLHTTFYAYLYLSASVTLFREDPCPGEGDRIRLFRPKWKA